jgi:hypothetical protein
METFSFTALDLHGIHPTFIMACRLTGDIYNSSAVWLMLDEATRVTALTTPLMNCKCHR